MGKKHRTTEPEPGVEAPELPAPDAVDAAQPEPGLALVEPVEQAVQRLEREVAEWKDRALRAAADLDNFRKRMFRDRDEVHGRGQAEAFARILDVIDDLARVAHLDPEQTTAAALHEGMLQIERKFLKALETAGVERVDPAGQPFDPNVAEAVTMLPAPTAEQDHTVGAVFQYGYRFKQTLLRPARVAVFEWRGETPPTPPPPADPGAVS